MISFMNYNFMADGNSVDPTPTNVNNITSIRLQNGIYDDLYVTKDVDNEYSSDVPTEWDMYTTLFAKLEGNLNAGNAQAILDRISSIRIKRREYGTFDWATLYEKPINPEETGSLSLVFEDYFAKNNTRYEYAWVPVSADNEGDYIIKDILSQFSGVFVADVESIYKFSANVGYDNMQRVQKIGVFEPYGRKYPVYVSNALTNYETGGFSATLIGDYMNTHVLDRNEMSEERKRILDFLTDKKVKMIKDDNGNQWLVVVVGTPNVSFNQNWGNGIATVNFQWSEIGDASNPKDLKDAGIAK